MKTWRLILADLTRLRWWIVLQGVTGLAIDAIGWLVATHPIVGSDHIVRGTWGKAGLAVGLLNAIATVTAYLLVVLLVQGDRLVGTRSYWLTRPISGGRLLGAKVIVAIFGLIVVPACASLPWWLWNGFAARHLVAGTLEIAVVACVVGLPTAWFSALVDSVPRAVTWGVLAVPLILAAIGSRSFLRVDGGRFSPGSGMILIASCYLAALGVALAVQYVTRRYAPAALALLLGLAAAFSTEYAWRKQSHPLHAAPPSTQASDASGITVKLLSSSLGGHVMVDGQKARQIHARFSISGTPAGTVVLPSDVTERWSWSDGTEFIRHRVVVMGNPNEGFGAALRRDHEGSRPEAAVQWSAVTFAPLSVADRIAKNPESFHATMNLSLVRPRLAAELPLAPGRLDASGGHGLRVTKVDRSESAVHIVCVHVSPDAPVSAIVEMLWRRGWAAADQWPPVVLRSRSGDQIIFENPRPVTSVAINAVKLTYSVSTFDAAWTVGSPDASWLRDATLARIDVEPLGQLTRDILP